MLSNKNTAAEVEKIMREFSAALDGSTRCVMETCPHDEFNAYRLVIGQIMGSIYLDVMKPIYCRYPDLELGGWRES
ncbi:MAG TPA: hypothetical protein VH251_00980 [Verrucomicrobiae bacterium]|jgi:hypothetical protein|nr:hypothetical protein [Verrucomicrobiae bacterium]